MHAVFLILGRNAVGSSGDISNFNIGSGNHKKINIVHSNACLHSIIIVCLYFAV